MWLSTPSVDSLTRPRVAVAVVSAIAAASIGYYAYQNQVLLSASSSSSANGGLHRSNAIRRTRRNRRSNATSTSSSSSIPGDENLDTNAGAQAENQPPAEDSGVEEWWNDTGTFPSTQRAGHNIVTLLFRVSEDNARRNGCVHRGCQCNSCGVIPIRGIRYRCANCADFDLCENCEAQGVHIKTHIFYKIRVPAPPFGARQMQSVWYTGDPDSCRRNLPKALIGKLSRMTGFERPELEAFWEQWTFMASTEWRDDPDELGIAMDRKTFERCLVPTGGSRHAAPNLIHDRMFSFYDYNNDGLIGFTEFLVGLSYRKQQDKLRKVFEGYDLDGDGYVSRRDFLRMFRAYYVLYKQMHKDILDGLKDELLSSVEAQQLVTSRQPLSSLFGREGRVPPADGDMRFEGKTYHPDGSIDVADGYEEVIVDDETDTAGREEILTSLFAYDTEQGEPRTRHRLTTHIDANSNWRTVRRLSTAETDRAYLVALLEPPSTLEELPDALMSNRILGMDEMEEDTSEEDEPAEVNGDRAPNGPRVNGAGVTLSEMRAINIARRQREAPELEKRRRDMARRQMHERWKRRQFYLDEEEGGTAPEDWEDEEDILDQSHESLGSPGPGPSGRPQSGSKAPFAEDTDGWETQSNASTSSSLVSDRSEGFAMPSAEQDAGREILYQVTQQAFNELLDSIFKPVEEVAIQAAETKAQRKKWKHLLDATELISLVPETKKPAEESLFEDLDKPVSEKTLEELLADSGFSIDDQEPRNAVEINGDTEMVQDEESTQELENLEEPAQPEPEPAEPTELAEHRDFTLPQFRPNSDSQDAQLPELGPSYPITDAAHIKAIGAAEPKPKAEPEPSPSDLQRWKCIEIAEAAAEARGGWGYLNFQEFERIYHDQEAQGNRLDYLGSWIDFCIR